jgi:hypothetical protein
VYFALVCPIETSQKALAKCTQRSAVGASKHKIVNVYSDEDAMAVDSNTPDAALKSHIGAPLALEMNAHGSMPSASRAGHAIERTTG